MTVIDVQPVTSGTVTVTVAVTGDIESENGSESGTVWGDITGTLANQTDLQAALDEIVDFVTPEQYGAVGDGTTDDQGALALALASGEPVLITKTHRIATDWIITGSTAVIFAGGKIKPDSGIQFGGNAAANIQVVGGNQYIDFSNGGVFRTNATDNRGPGLKISQYMPANMNTASDAEFKAALKDLFNLGYYSLDLEGRTVVVDASFDMATVTGLTSKATWRRIHNGQITPSTTFTTNSPTSTGTLTADCSMTAGSAVVTTTTTAALAVGMEVSGTGIVRGTFIISVDSATDFTMSEDAMTTGASRTVTWKKHAYIFDFSGFTALSRFTFDNLHFNCNERASVYFGSQGDDIIEFKDCRFVRPETFAICQWYGGGGAVVDGCDFLTNDSAVAIASRTRIGCILNGDSRVINNRWAYFKNAVIFKGGSTQFVGNHPFAGMSSASAHNAGVIYQQKGRHVIVGNYIDNGWLEFTNEAFASVAAAEIGGASITGNLFTTVASSAAEGFIVLAPYIASSTLVEMTITGNLFRPIVSSGGVSLTQTMIQNTTNGTIDAATVQKIHVSDNTFDNVTHRQEEPARAKSTVSSGTTVNVDFVNKTVFGLSPLFALGILIKGANDLGAVRSTGVTTTNVSLAWPTAASVSTDLIVTATVNSVSIT